MRCACGCGTDAGVYKRTHKSSGHVEGEPKRFVQGHNSMHGTHIKVCKRGHPRVEGELKCRVCRAAACRNWGKNNPEKLRALNLKFKFKITPEVIDEKLTKQNNRCALCDSLFCSENLPCVDHSHKCCSGDRSCGKCVRGLLCSTCNSGLGHLHDDVTLLEKGIQYLKKWETQWNNRNT
jgi:hypothetical protein